jgi:hypothetical protein
MDATSFPNLDAAKAAMREEISLDDFWAYMPMHNYIYAPARAHWPGASVNSRLPAAKLTDGNGQPLRNDKGEEIIVAPTKWLDKHKPVEQMIWAPGLPMIIRNRLLLEGGWTTKHGVACFNLYQSPTILRGKVGEAGKWTEHVRLVYPDEADHILDWLAHRVQRPDEKINHALVLGGEQGIGKDTLLEPVRQAIGPWNFQEASPIQVLGRFNGFLKSVILRVNEARDLGEHDRFAFYDHLKAYTAAPPETLRIDEKFLREYSILNCCGVIITTNHMTDGIYLPTDDRRHFVAWSNLSKDDGRFQNGYWLDLWKWYQQGGAGHVAVYLAQRDLRRFDPKAPPPKTPAFWTIVDSNRATEVSELADAIDRLSSPDPADPGKLIPPDALTLDQLRIVAAADLSMWLMDRKNRRTIPHRLESCGYVPVRNPDRPADGLWTVSGKRQAIYARKELPLREQITVARGVGAQ